MPTPLGDADEHHDNHYDQTAADNEKRPG